MTSTQIGGIVAAALVVLWPQIKFAGSWLAVAAAGLMDRQPEGEPERPATIGPSFTDAVGHLSKVRARLITTDALGEEQKKAIEVLTLALVAGSDK